MEGDWAEADRGINADTTATAARRVLAKVWERYLFIRVKLGEAIPEPKSNQGKI
jgi:hypothetical protein